MKKHSIFFLIVVLLFTMCDTDDFNFDKMSDKIIWEPELVGPVGKGNFTLWDFVEQGDDNITVGDGDVIKVMHKEQDIVSVDINDLFKVSDIQTVITSSFTSEPVDVDDVSIMGNQIRLEDLATNYSGLAFLLGLNGQDQAFPNFSSTNQGGSYEFNNIDDFQNATFSTGTLTLEATNNLKVPVSFKLSMVNFLNVELFTFDFMDLDPGEKMVITKDLQDKEMFANQTLRLVEFSSPGSTSPVNINLDDAINIDLKVEDAKVSSGVIKIPEQLASTSESAYDIEISEDVKLSQLNLKSGILSVNIETEMNDMVTVRLTLPSVQLNGAVATKDIVVPTSGTNVSWDLAGAEIDLTTVSGKDYNSLPVKYELILGQGDGFFDFESNRALTANVRFRSVALAFAQGDFGNLTVDVEEDVLDLGVDFWDDIDGGFTLTNPKLNFKIRNSIGVGAELDFDVKATSSKGTEQALNGDNLSIPYPQSVSEGTVEGTIGWNKDNSDIVALVALPPSGDVTYGGVVRLNPGSQGVNTNFISETSSISADLEFDLPFEVKTQGLGITDTIEVTGSDFDKLKSAELEVKYTNGIPLGMNVNFAFIDTISKQKFDEISAGLLTAAPVDAQGIPTGSKEGSAKITLTESNVKNLIKSNGIVMKIQANSPENGTKPARLLSKSKLNVKLIMKAKADFSK
ncbi:hypothetical protein EMN47_07595 [Prolixibacteraceae bacterium JC049]|nr:hypothetical protein [Prolixibacteraceae bacterium JC049]